MKKARFAFVAAWCVPAYVLMIGQATGQNPPAGQGQGRAQNPAAPAQEYPRGDP